MNKQTNTKEDAFWRIVSEMLTTITHDLERATDDLQTISKVLKAKAEGGK